MIRLLVQGGLAAGTLPVTGDDHHYLFRVRRLTLGDALVVCDGDGVEADAVVVAIDAEVGQLALATPRPATVGVGPELLVLLPLIKGERMDLALEKVVELGATGVVPFAAARSVVRLDPARAAERHRRYLAIVRAAASQCRAPRACAVAPIADLAAALVAGRAAELRLVFSEQAAAPPLRAVLPASRPASVALLTGPEGGLTDDELVAARAAGFVAASLGSRILRAETAAIAAIALVGHAVSGPGG